MTDNKDKDKDKEQEKDDEEKRYSYYARELMPFEMFYFRYLIK